MPQLLLDPEMVEFLEEATDLQCHRAHGPTSGSRFKACFPGLALDWDQPPQQPFVSLLAAGSAFGASAGAGAATFLDCAVLAEAALPSPQQHPVA